MEFREFIKTAFNPMVHSNSNKYSLVIGYGTQHHEPVLCELFNALISSGLKELNLTKSSINFNLDNACVIWIGLQNPAKMYTNLFSSNYRFMLQADNLLLVDASSKIDKYLADNLMDPLDEQIGTNLLKEMKTDIEEFFKKHNTIETCLIFIDNLTWLIDFGIGLQQINNFLLKLGPIDSSIYTTITIGLNVAETYSNSTTSDSDFVHFVELWKNRASIIIELKPLSTGYTPMIDGQFSLQSKLETSKSPTTTFHYQFESKCIRLFPSGTSKLVT